MKLTIESFLSQLEKALERGALGLDIAIECYLYAQNPGRLKEIRKLQPAYTQEATANEIRRIWKIDPQTYLRISLKLGGGDMDSGRAAMKKFGTNECERAEKNLGATQIEKLCKAIPKMDSPSEFSAEIDKLRNELEELAKENKGDGPVRPSLSWKQKFEKLLNDHSALNEEYATFRTEMTAKVAGLSARLEERDKEIEWIRSQVKVASMAG